MIEDRSVVRSSIINAGNSVSPSSFESSIPLAEENLIILKTIKLVELILDSLYFFSQLLWLFKRSLGTDVRRRCIKYLFGFIQQLYFLRKGVQMILSLFFKNSFSFGELVFECLFIAQGLHWRRSIVLVGVFGLLVILATH